jgi:predicted nuclease of predicted toxin-antitoxin system
MEKLYVNENFPMPVVVYLRQFGYDVLTSLEAGNANQSIPDEEVLAFSTAHKRVLLTINRRDFIKLHRLNSNHLGIIVCTEDTDFQALAHRIHLEISKNMGQLTNNLFRVYRPVT